MGGDTGCPLSASKLEVFISLGLIRNINENESKVSYKVACKQISSYWSADGRDFHHREILFT